MYKLGTPPSISGNISELADFLEAQCLFSDEGIYSLASARSTLSIESDECNHEGIDSDDDRILRKLEDALIEIRERRNRTQNKYPFTIDHSVVKLNIDDGLIYYIYSYLLLATRSSMQGKKDTQLELMEHYYLKNYLRLLQNHILVIILNLSYSEHLPQLKLLSMRRYKPY